MPSSNTWTHKSNGHVWQMWTLLGCVDGIHHEILQRRTWLVDPRMGNHRQYVWPYPKVHISSGHARCTNFTSVCIIFTYSFAKHRLSGAVFLFLERGSWIVWCSFSAFDLICSDSRSQSVKIRAYLKSHLFSPLRPRNSPTSPLVCRLRSKADGGFMDLMVDIRYDVDAVWGQSQFALSACSF